MKLKIYSIKDTIIGEYQSPIYMVNDGTALRAVTNAVNSTQDNPVKENAKDKQLYCLGVFDTDTGIIETEIKFITNLSDLITKE